MVADPSRALAMGERVLRLARERGASDSRLGRAAGAAQIRSALETAHVRAMAPRVARLDDDHDPHLLHPGRTALILLLDLDETDAATLCGALLTDSERPDLRATDTDVLTDTAGDPREILRAGLAIRRAIPDPSDPALAECLVSADEAVRRVALCERLDQARHAHMWRTAPQHARLLAEVEATYGPVAHRTHPLLAKRFERWITATRQRLAREERGRPT